MDEFIPSPEALSRRNVPECAVRSARMGRDKLGRPCWDLELECGAVTQMPAKRYLRRCAEPRTAPCHCAKVNGRS